MCSQNIYLCSFINRRLGYIVDLEDRRGKDEQRVDEGLHLWIYKVSNLCLLVPFPGVGVRAGH